MDWVGVGQERADKEGWYSIHGLINREGRNHRAMDVNNSPSWKRVNFDLASINAFAMLCQSTCILVAYSFCLIEHLISV